MIKLYNRKVLALLVLLISLIAPFKANAGIPTTDPGQLAGRALDLAGKAVHYTKVITDARNRLRELENTVTEARNIYNNAHGAIEEIGNFDFRWEDALQLNVPAAADELMGLYDQFSNADTRGIENGESGGSIVLSDRAFDLYQKISTDMNCEVRLDLVSRNECKRRAAKQGHDQGVIVDAIENLDLRMNNIRQIMTDLGTVTTQKEREALIGRLGAEQASLQAENMKLALYQEMINKQDELYQQRESINHSKKFDSTVLIEPQPIDWGAGFGSLFGGN